MEYSLVGTDDPNCFPHHLFRQVASLTFRWKSPMKRAFVEFWHQRRKARLVWLTARDEPTKVLAWGLLQWHPSTQLDADGKAWDPACPEIMLYVRRGVRRGGLARQVFWALRHTLPGDNAKYIYYGHDVKSSAFYQKRIEERQSGAPLPRPEVLWLSPP